MPARNSQRELDPEIVTGVRPARRSPAEVAREFRALVSGGAELRPAGEGRDDPGVFLTRRYLPRHAVSLFGARCFLTDFRLEEGMNLLVE